MNDISELNTLIKNLYTQFRELFYQASIALATQYLKFLDESMGVASTTKDGGPLWKWTLSTDHLVDPSEICDINASADTGYGVGVYKEKEIPQFPAHYGCKCSLVSLSDTTTPASDLVKSRWQVVISRTKIEFFNNSAQYIEKKEGTPTKLKGNIVEDPGKDPNNFDTPIFDMFLRELDGLVNEVGNKTFKE